MKSVSRVINREPNVRESMKRKVEAAIGALGYVPDVAARALAGARSFVIMALFDNPSPAYTVAVLDGAMKYCRERGYHLIIENVDGKAGDLAGQLRAILSNSRIDGMILTPPLTDSAEILDVLDERKILYVRIAPVTFPGRSPAIFIDDAAAAGEIYRHFDDLGHRRLGIVNGPSTHGAAGARTRGFCAAARKGPETTIVQAQGDFSFMSGIEAGTELLTRTPRPTAIFAANDDMAAGVVAAAGRMGLRVPADLSVAGFDNSWIAQSVWPPITTIHQPVAEMAEAAARLLIDRPAMWKDVDALQMDYVLIIRESTAPLE